MKTHDSSRNEYPTASQAIGRLIDNLTEVWFDKESENLSRPWRLLCAFLGSATCFAFATKVIVDGLVERFLPGFFGFALDPELKAVSIYLVLPIFVILSLFFASIVAYEGRRSGPVRSYLAAFLLPVFIMWTLDRVFFS